MFFHCLCLVWRFWYFKTPILSSTALTFTFEDHSCRSYSSVYCPNHGHKPMPRTKSFTLIVACSFLLLLKVSRVLVVEMKLQQSNKSYYCLATVCFLISEWCVIFNHLLTFYCITLKETLRMFLFFENFTLSSNTSTDILSVREHAEYTLRLCCVLPLSIGQSNCAT